MLENTEELKSQLNNPEEEEEENKEKEEKGEEEEEEKDEKEKGAGAGGEEFQMPDKFKGKSAAEIAKSYTELESMIEKKAQIKAEELAKQKVEEDENEEEPEETALEEEPPMEEGKIDYASMTPEQFAQWVDRRIELKTEAKAREIISNSRKIRTSVQTEIKEAQKDHPNLKESSDYRELVLAIIEAAASKGKTIRLKEACEKVDALVGGKKKEVGEDEEAKLKKAKAEVETAGGAASGGKETEEEAIKRGMLAGSKRGELGELGI